MKICPNCNRGVEDDSSFCGYCSKPIPPKARIVTADRKVRTDEPVECTTADGEVGKPKQTRYPALNVIIGYYNILSALIIGLTVIISSVLLFVGYKSNSGLLSLLTASGVLIIGAVLSITTRAMAEGIAVFIDIEANTRKAAGN